MKKKLLPILLLTLLLSACSPVVSSSQTPSSEASSETTVSSEESSSLEEPSVSSEETSSEELSSEEVSSEEPSSEEIEPSEEPSYEEPSSEEPEYYTYTVSQSVFNSTADYLNNDKNVRYECYQGGGTAEPAINNSVIRLYQNANGSGGGYVTLKVSEGCSIVSASVGTDMNTSIRYWLDGSNKYSSTYSLNKGAKFELIDLSNESVSFQCMGTSKSARLYVNYLSVTYVTTEPTGGNQPIEPPTSSEPSSEEPSSSEPSYGEEGSYPDVPDNYTGSYYNNINDSAAPNTVLGQLRDLIVDTHTTYTSYSDCGSGSSKLKLVDKDLNSSGNNIRLFYCGQSVSYSSSSFNREHVWPKSKGFWDTSKGGADMHHIRPTDNKINSTRSSLPFGEVSGGKQAIGNNGMLGGYYGGGAFEPLDNVKGDVARIIMYMFVHYNSPSTLGSNTNKSGNCPTSETCPTSGNLPLTNVFAGSKTEAFKTLLKWHNEDPVDKFEINRNNEVYKIQGNRNPFIDKPSYADYIWG